MENDDAWLFIILRANEEHLSLDGGVNSQNCRIRATSNPHEYSDVPLQPVKVNVCYTFTASFMILSSSKNVVPQA